MEENLKINSNDIKDLTNRIRECFSSESSDENTKWLLLNQYYTCFLLTKQFDKDVAASYTSVLSTLLDTFKSNLITEKCQETLFDNIFLQGIHHQALLTMIKRLDQGENHVVQKILDLLLKFTQGSSFESLFIYQCESRKDWNIRYVSKSNFWDDLITAIVSLPERIANKTKGNFVKLFRPTSFIPFLLSSVFKVLDIIHNQLEETENIQQEYSLEFLAKLTGRICMIGHADIVAKKFSKEMIKLSKSDFIWRRLSQNFITKMPSISLDSFITNLLLEIPWYGYVDWILGDEGVENEKINYIMTVKLLFCRPFKQAVLQNSIGYFASSSSRIPHFMTTLNLLLDSWIDKRALKHQSLDQKIYIASALMVCAGWLKQLKLEFEKKTFVERVLEGTQIRLESSLETVRSLGLIVGGNLVQAIDPECQSLKLEECADMDLVTHLKSVMEIPLSPGDTSILSDDLKCFDEVKSECKDEISGKDNSDTTSALIEDESDDDLEPYDMSHDIPVSEKKKPRYIRDCMMGLIDQDVEWAENCLKHAEELIKANPYATEEVAEEMAKIVLHLGNNFSLSDFIALRHRILIALTVQSPIAVSSYLISQFSERDYTIRQRLDILEVLATSSAMLSTASLPVLESQSNSLKEDFTKKDQSWQMIVQERLEAKTKRYTKAEEPATKENKFSAVCGNFFYPLLNSYEGISKLLKLHGRDSYVLGRFIYTLGIMMYYAANTLHCGQMGITLLQFLSTLRSHTDEFVRKSIIFAVSTTYIAVPSSLLFSEELLQDVTDSVEWLQSIAQNDPDSDCMVKALHALSILQSITPEDSLVFKLKNLVL